MKSRLYSYSFWDDDEDICPGCFQDKCIGNCGLVRDEDLNPSRKTKMPIHSTYYFPRGAGRPIKRESERLVNLRSRLAELRAWTLSCYRDEDDHGLRDAGADMAVVRAQIKLLEEFER